MRLRSLALMNSKRRSFCGKPNGLNIIQASPIMDGRLRSLNPKLLRKFIGLGHGNIGNVVSNDFAGILRKLYSISTNSAAKIKHAFSGEIAHKPQKCFEFDLQGPIIRDTQILKKTIELYFLGLLEICWHVHV